MLREIDTRIIPGVARIVWFMDEGSHWISARSSDTGQLFLLEFEHGKDAHEAFHHPFSRPDVPDIFKREPVTA